MLFTCSDMAVCALCELCGHTHQFYGTAKLRPGIIYETLFLDLLQLWEPGDRHLFPGDSQEFWETWDPWQLFNHTQ